MATKKLRPLSIVVILWDDAASSSLWHTKKESARWARRRYKVRSAGLLVSDTKRGITLALSHNCYGGYGDLLRIPRGMVLDVRVLRRARR